MATLTFDQLEAIAARRHADADKRNTAKAQAIRAVYALTSLLGDLNDGDHYAVRELLRAELAVLDQRAWDQFGAALADRDVRP